MSSECESFVFYRSFRESIKVLKTKEQLITLLAICDYALYGIEPDLSGAPHAIFTVAKPSIDANRVKRENGKKGGRPKKSKSCGFECGNHWLSEYGSTETDTETEAVSDAVTEAGAPAPPPTHRDGAEFEDLRRRRMKDVLQWKP